MSEHKRKSDCRDEATQHCNEREVALVEERMRLHQAADLKVQQARVCPKLNLLYSKALPHDKYGNVDQSGWYGFQ